MRQIEVAQQRLQQRLDPLHALLHGASLRSTTSRRSTDSLSTAFCGVSSTAVLSVIDRFAEIGLQNMIFSGFSIAARGEHQALLIADY